MYFRGQLTNKELDLFSRITYSPSYVVAVDSFNSSANICEDLPGDHSIGNIYAQTGRSLGANPGKQSILYWLPIAGGPNLFDVNYYGHGDKYGKNGYGYVPFEITNSTGAKVRSNFIYVSKDSNGTVTVKLDPSSQESFSLESVTLDTCDILTNI